MFELRLLCPEDRVETVGEALEALDALSVSVEDADAQTDAEQALFGEPGMPPPKEGWQRSRVLALFQARSAADEAARLLQAQDFFAGCHVLGVQEVPEQDWVRLTQSQFAPVEITPAFWIVPTWHEPPAQATQVIRLDPGLAFGTGTHPTTRMCLRWIAAHPLRGQRVLDYGCGSGILAIGAATFGAASVDAVDIDEAAVRSTGDNGEQVQFLLDGRVAAWTFGVSLVTALAFGIAPALFAMRLDLNDALKSGVRGATVGRGHQRFRQVLIVAQFALAMVLLAGAGLFIRGLYDLNNRRAGWESQRL
ncbi:MAG TPA: 50S ribosomal protein L11 methyltransferase, partial [Ramlibacter sp.]|nr:50S ribosomal protein L11 methyltransferase [Ramlibacter sp.]